MSITGRAAALARWWAALPDTASQGALDAALKGSHLLQSIVPGLVTTEALVLTPGYTANTTATTTAFLTPRDVRAFLVAHTNPATDPV